MQRLSLYYEYRVISCNAIVLSAAISCFRLRNYRAFGCGTIVLSAAATIVLSAAKHSRKPNIYAGFKNRNMRARL
jgi:hypothetical protein